MSSTNSLAVPVTLSGKPVRDEDFAELAKTPILWYMGHEPQSQARTDVVAIPINRNSDQQRRLLGHLVLPKPNDKIREKARYQAADNSFKGCLSFHNIGLDMARLLVLGKVDTNLAPSSYWDKFSIEFVTPARDSIGPLLSSM